MRNREDFKVFKDVFDRPTHFALNKLMNRHVFECLGGEISIGKEANVFFAEDENEEPMVVKIYRISAADFKNMKKYALGDPRFQDTRSKRKFIYNWATKEFRNLLRLQKAGIPAPSPIDYFYNVIVMEFIGENWIPSPQLRFIEKIAPDPEFIEKIYKRIIEYIIIMYREAELVHGDLSEYNILLHKENPVIIDCAQGVSIDHPMAREFLEKDVRNIQRFFHCCGIDIIEDSDIFNKIYGDKNV